MIRTIKLDVNAAYPNMPLEPVNVFAGSAASFTICNVPRAVGDRSITSVSLVFKTRGGLEETIPAVRVGSAWEVTIQSSKLPLPYSAALGIRIVGVGIDENKVAATWVLGVADLVVLNNQGQVTPGADAGDVKHSDFSDLDPDTTPLAVVIERLKGSAMSLVLVLASLLASLTAVAALPVTPAYTNNNRFTGMVMTNLQQWAAAVDEAIGQGGGGSGGADTNAVNDLIREYDETNLTARIDAKADLDELTAATNAIPRDRITDGTNTVMANLTVVNSEESLYFVNRFMEIDFLFLKDGDVWKTQDYPSGPYALIKKMEPSIGTGYEFWPFGIEAGTEYPFSENYTTPQTVGNFGTMLSAKTNILHNTRLATTNDIPSTAAIESSVASVSKRQDALEGYIAGHRVRVSVTNYYGNTSGQLPRLRIEELITATNVTDGVATETNYWQTVWDEQSKYERFLSEAKDAISAMTNNLYQTYYALLMERMNTKAPRAWGTLTSAGEAAPAGSVWHTEPNTVFAGGTEYAHAMVGTGVIGVLTTKGASVYTDGETGRFHFTTDDKTAYFGMNIATRYELGCATDGITVTSVGGNQMVDLLYNVTMTGKPILYYKTNVVQNAWEQITDSAGGSIPGATVYASWDQSPPAGSEICTINCGSGISGFFKAAIEYAGVSKFETNMMADLSGGIVATNQTSGQSQPVEPYINNGSVLWRVKQ